MLSDPDEHGVEFARGLGSADDILAPGHVLAVPGSHVTEGREADFPLPDLRDGPDCQLELEEAWVRKGSLAEEREGVVYVRVGVEGEDAAVEYGGIVGDWLGIVLLWSAGHSGIVRCGVDQVDVVADSSVCQFYRPWPRDSTDCSDWFCKAAFEEGVNCVRYQQRSSGR
jgi:hypothetical protein